MSPSSLELPQINVLFFMQDDPGLAFCDRLEASLDQSAATRRRLLDALLHDALEPVADREMEAAE